MPSPPQPPPWRTRAVGMAIGLGADALWGDPRRHHPVAWFGTAASWAEAQMWADSRARGLWFTAVTTIPMATAGVLLERCTRRHPWLHVLATALTTWTVVGARSLAREGTLMAEHLEAGDLLAARARLGNLCGRDPAGLDEPELARAAVESMAENTADSAVASILWGAVLGIPGMMTHRCVNTLDAMVGRRNERYGRFGTASARLDDVMDLVPARVTGLTTCLFAGTVGGDRSHAWSMMRRDAHRHPSPNGGWCESAWAGALGVQLGGRNVYSSRVEERPLLGEGPRPHAPELRRAAQLVGVVTGAVGTAAVLTLLTGGARR